MICIAKVYLLTTYTVQARNVHLGIPSLQKVCANGPDSQHQLRRHQQGMLWYGRKSLSEQMNRMKLIDAANAQRRHTANQPNVAGKSPMVEMNGARSNLSMSATSKQLCESSKPYLGHHYIQTRYYDRCFFLTCLQSACKGLR